MYRLRRSNGRISWKIVELIKRNNRTMTPFLNLSRRYEIRWWIFSINEVKDQIDLNALLSSRNGQNPNNSRLNIYSLLFSYIYMEAQLPPHTLNFEAKQPWILRQLSAPPTPNPRPPPSFRRRTVGSLHRLQPRNPALDLTLGPQFLGWDGLVIFTGASSTPSTA